MKYIDRNQEGNTDGLEFVRERGTKGHGLPLKSARRDLETRWWPGPLQRGGLVSYYLFQTKSTTDGLVSNPQELLYSRI